MSQRVKLTIRISEELHREVTKWVGSVVTDYENINDMANRLFRAEVSRLNSVFQPKEKTEAHP